jgi:transposase-like protein
MTKRDGFVEEFPPEIKAAAVALLASGAMRVAEVAALLGESRQRVAAWCPEAKEARTRWLSEQWRSAMEAAAPAAIRWARTASHGDAVANNKAGSARGARRALALHAVGRMVWGRVTSPCGTIEGPPALAPAADWNPDAPAPPCARLRPPKGEYPRLTNDNLPCGAPSCRDDQDGDVD